MRAEQQCQCHSFVVDGAHETEHATVDDRNQQQQQDMGVVVSSRLTNHSSTCATLNSTGTRLLIVLHPTQTYLIDGVLPVSQTYRL
jgi:hypothetical protein